MNNIVIVEDKLKRGIALAKQFEELSENRKDIQFKVADICFFCANKKRAKEEIESVKMDNDNLKFGIEHVTLINFDEIMNRYFEKETETERYFLIMDYILEDDGSDGVPRQRVNVRYALRNKEEKKSKIWFYTGTGTQNVRVLEELFGREQVISVKKAGTDSLELDIENSTLAHMNDMQKSTV